MQITFKEEIIDLLVEQFKLRLTESPLSVIYTCYAEYLKQEENKIQGVETNEI